MSRFLLGMPAEQLVFASAEQLGRLTGTSDATVVRTARKLGYTGLPELKRAVGQALAPSEQPRETLSRRLSNLPTDVPGMVERVFADAAESLELTAASIDEAALQTAFELLAHARSVVTFGYGHSELPARHLARTFARLGLDAWYAGSTGLLLADELLRVRQGDVVVIFQPVRPLHDLEVLVERARMVGARTVLVSEQPLADHFRDSVDVSLQALRAPGEFSAEGLSAVVLVDVLAMGMARLDEHRAVSTREQFTHLREQLIGR